MGYLVVFLHPQTSTFRMLLPLFPLALGAVLLSRSRAYRGTVVTMFLLLQIVWIVWLWAWAQLPGGGRLPALTSIALPCRSTPELQACRKCPSISYGRVIPG